jgi:cytoskeletal protein CcmA (bactofilin family)
MAVFSSGAERTGESSGRQAGREGSLSIVAAGMRVVGEIATDGVLKVEGVVEGTIRADREVLVAKGGTIEGDVYTREVIVGGKVIGSLYVDERVEVQQNSLVQGDIVTKKLIVHEGGEVNGSVQMGEPKALEQAASVAARREAVPASGSESEAYT